MSSEHVGPAIVGGLVVRNGRHRGTRVPLKLPVTVIGSGDQCDVKVRGGNVADWHCVIAMTPAGPTLRSWASENTLVNGHAVTATVLKHGDELTVGPCQFRVAWFGELDTAEPELPTALAEVDHEWTFHEREQSLHEQEKQIAAILETKQRQVEELLAQLQSNREQFHAERGGVAGELAAAKKLRKEAEALRKQADADRLKHHRTYHKLVRRATQIRQDGEKANAAVAAKLDADRDRLTMDRVEFETVKARWQTESAESSRRLADAWAMLEDGNRRLLKDRQDFDSRVAAEQDALAKYEAELNHRDRTMVDAHARLESRCSELQAEIIGLDRRAAEMQFVVHELEHRRITLEAEAAPVKAKLAMTAELVPLNSRSDRSFDELMADLTTRERELEVERKAVAVQKHDFDRLTSDMADQRSALVAQFHKLAAATRLWQQEECNHAMELERLAGELDSRERVVANREHRLLLAEDQCRQRERDLWAFRVKLEGWQVGLTAHESRWYAERDRVDAEVEKERERLLAWEQSLTQLCATWQDVRAKERETLLAELNHWSADRRTYLTALKDLDDERIAFARQATLLAARMTATEEAAASVDSKRLRVLQKKWEAHFRRFEKLWDARLTATQKLAKSLDGKITTMKAETAQLTDKKAKKLAEAQERERQAVIDRRIAMEATVSKTVIANRPPRAERELHELRSEVERISAVLMNTPMPTGEESLIALMPAKAA